MGDPINAVRIFNEKEADELIVLDIGASAAGVAPNVKRIEALAAECRMPLCYGGGVKTVEEALEIFRVGVEKVALSTQALVEPMFVRKLADRVGTQSVVIVLDVKKNRAGAYEVFSRNGKIATGIGPTDFAKKFQQLGAGEIVVNSIDNDGVMKGFDMALIAQVRSAVDIPITVIGGCANLSDVGKVIETFGILGVAAGSMFLFKGIYRAVLINYPNPIEKDLLIQQALKKYATRAEGLI